MSDLLIRDLPEDVVQALDAEAVRLGLSRNELLRRHLVSEARRFKLPVTTADLVRSSEIFRDLGDPEVMAGAWR